MSYFNNCLSNSKIQSIIGFFVAFHYVYPSCRRDYILEIWIYGPRITLVRVSSRNQCPLCHPPRQDRWQIYPPGQKKKIDPTKVISVFVDEDGILEPSNECSQRCTYYFSQKNDDEGVCWKKVPNRTKDFYWGEFKKYITHSGYTEEVIKKAWQTKVAGRYSDWISAMSKLETKPVDEGISQSTWNEWKKYWKTDEFLEKSARGKRNRNRNGQGMVNHIGGSQTFKVALKRLHAKDIYPDPCEFHRLTHCFQKRPEIFCDDKARQVHVDYSVKEKETLSKVHAEAEVSGLPKPDQLPLTERTVLFKETAGGVKRRRVYGSGSAVSHFYTIERKGSCSSEDASSSSQGELKQEILELRMALAQEKEERNKMISEAIGKTERHFYKMFKKMMHNGKPQFVEQESSDDDGDADEY